MNDMIIDSLVSNLKTEYKEKGGMTYETLMQGVDSLRGKNTIKRYFDTYVQNVKEDIQKDIYNEVKSAATDAINGGKISIDDASIALGKDRFRYILSKYSSRKHKGIHEAWNNAIPSLYRNGKLPNILGF